MVIRSSPTTLDTPAAHGTHWRRYARQWDLLGPPLRPTAQDVAQLQDVCSALATHRRQALLLGVTPEYARMAWPAGTALTAVDKCADMIEQVWPRDAVPGTFRAIEADWTALPLDNRSIDFAVGDGISTVLPRWSMFDDILRELQRVCAPGATIALRLFIKPERPDTLAQLMADVRAGRLHGFHAFKLRLLMLLQENLARGVAPKQAWQVWQQLRQHHAASFDGCEWSAGEIGTIDAYATSNDTYWFATLQEATAALARRFAVREIRFGEYELAACCPLFVLQHGG